MVGMIGFASSATTCCFAIGVLCNLCSATQKVRMNDDSFCEQHIKQKHIEFHFFLMPTVLCLVDVKMLVLGVHYHPRS